MTAIVGPSGAGKSTLLYIVGLMLSPTSGDVLWDGEIVSTLADAERSRLRAARVGFVFQDAALDSTRTVAANVAEGGLYAGVPRSVITRRRRDLLDRFGVMLRDNHRPGEVSGGQAQRVALARAMIKDPDIVLADEPTGNLDEAAADVVMEALAERAAGGAVVIVATHDTRLAGIASRRLELTS
ncbi:MAG: ABC transporter ATP-binding protein [Actinobacteria bacterium]|nr:ABC transporter ATP-binding protein [Actinomycetota bacterium]